MDEDWSDEFEEETFPIITAGLSYRDEYVWIDGIHISPDDCPDCLKYEGFDCDLCTFLIPGTCKLLHDPIFMQDVGLLFDIYRERREKQLQRQEAILCVIQTELQAHGRPLHYTVLARMIADRYPTLPVTELGVLRIMALHPNIFEKITEGVYQCR